MKNTNVLIFIAVIFIGSAFTISNAISWEILKDYSIKFETKKAEGDFENFSGDLNFAEDDLENASFEVAIEVNSISTGNWLKNRHAKGDNWFDAEAFPTINFTSDSFSKTSTGYQVTGQLTMHGITKTITIPFTFNDLVFSGEFVVNRTDFEIGKTTGMSGSVGQEVILKISVPVAKK